MNAPQIIDQVLTRAFPGTSEAGKQLYRAEVASWIKQALTMLPREAVERYLLDRRDTSFRSYLRTYALRPGLRDSILSWSEQQMWSAAHGWGASNATSIRVTQSESSSTITGVIQSMVAANERIAPSIVAAGQQSAPIANNYIEFVWGDEYAPVAVSLFREGVTPTASYEDRNSLLTLLVESPGNLSVYSESDNLVNPDETILMTPGTRIRAEFGSDGAIQVVLYTDQDVELARYPVYRWYPGMIGDGATLVCDAVTTNATDARMVGVALAGAAGAPVPVDWEQFQITGDEWLVVPSSKSRIGHYCLVSLTFEQVHQVVTVDNVGDLMPTVEGRWTQNGNFATEDIALTVVSTTQFHWKSASNVGGLLNFSTIAQPLGATGLSVVWNKPGADADELNTYIVTPFRLTPGSGWTTHAISSGVGNFINVVYGRFITAQDRQYRFFASAPTDVQVQASIYSNVDTLTPVAAVASGVTVDATTHQLAFVSAPTTSQAIALFFANPDGERFIHSLVDIAPLRITESCVPVVQFGEGDATVKDVRVGNLKPLAVSLPNDGLILDTVLKVGSVVFEGGKPLSWVGDQPSTFLPKVSGLWRWTIEDNQIQISSSLPSSEIPDARLLVTGCVIPRIEDLSAGEAERLIARLVAIARERAGVRAK